MMLYEMLKAEFTRNVFTRLVALIAYPVLRAFKRRIDPRLLNGATLIGLKGVVVKSHGSADALAFQHALRKAYAEAAHGVLDKIAQRMAAMPADRAGARRGRDDGGRCIAASPGPAAICPRRSSPTTSSRSASTRAMRGSGRAPASASAASPRPTRRPATSRRTPRAPRSPPPASRRRTSISSSWPRPRPDMVFPSTAMHPAGEARRRRRAGVRRAGGVQRIRLRAGGGRPDGRVGDGAATRSSSARRSIRASSTGTIAARACCSATAPAPSCSCRRPAPGIGSAHLHADGRYRDILCVPGTLAEGAVSGTPFVRMDGPAVFKFAVSVMAEVGAEALEANGVDASAVDWLIPHQANIRIMEATREEARRAARADDRHRRPARQHVGGVDSAGARRGRARRAHQARPPPAADRRRRRVRLGLGLPRRGEATT